MALTSYQPRFLRQPHGLVRINEKHWLADNLLFAHSGLQGFVRHEPATPILQALRRPAERGQINGLAVYGNNAAYEEFEVVCEQPNTLTLSAWSVVDSALSNNSGIISVGLPGVRSSLSLHVVSPSVDPALRASNTNGATGLTATGGGVAGQLQHLVGVARSGSDREIYINGASSGTSSVSRAIGGTSRVLIAADRSGTSGAIGNQARTEGSFAALQLVIDRGLADEEVDRLYREQLSDPWALFAPKRIWVPMAAAASGVPTLSLPTYVPGSLTSTGFRPRVTAT